ncbi:MAG: PEP-CTERM sorting domain-containing protein [Planctomycetaceae bacterium]|jgi:hypothetical protein|nr:PEP-CTERM sorting domain-containing protein [Planctomycetaceae bacterium]
MKKTFFTIVVILAFAVTVATNADTIYIGTGLPVTSQYHSDGANVTGTITDHDKNGYADGREFSSYSTWGDTTNTRDKNWSVMYTDVFNDEYKAKMNENNNSKVNARRSAVEYVLNKQGSEALGYVDYYKDHGARGGNYTGTTGASAKGTVYESTADLYGGIGMNNGGLSHFAVSDTAGVLTTYGGFHWEEYGSYYYNEDNSIDKLGNSSPATGFVGVQSGIVAFTTGFEMATGYNYINGAFSIMGELMGIYLNGTLLNSDLYYLSDNSIESGYNYAGRYNLELDLTNEFITSLLENGNNNLSFMILGIPLEFSGIDSGNPAHMSFIAFSADIAQNTESVNSINNVNVTPEPAAMLIFGIGLVALGLRRRFAQKD